MKIDKIELHNFRSAENLTINFDDKVNVLVGVNGAGKTTILEAIAISLSWLVNRIQNANGRGNYIKDSDVRYYSEHSSLTLQVSEENQTFQWQLVKTAKGYETKLKSELSESSQLASLYREKFRHGKDLPVIAYYPVSRTVENISLKTTLYYETFIFEMYENSLSSGGSYQSFFEWFRVQDDILNEIYSSRKQWIQKNGQLLKRILYSIISEWNKLDIVNNNNLDQPLGTSSLDDLMIHSDPNFIYYEFFSLISKMWQEIDRIVNEDQRVVALFELTMFLRNMERYFSQPKNSSNCHYGEITDDFNNAINKCLQLEISREEIAFFLKIFEEIHTITLWWVSTINRRKIFKYIDEYKKEILSGRTVNFPLLVTKIQTVLKGEREQHQLTVVSNGRELKIISYAIEKFLPEYKNLRVKRTPKPHMLIDKDGEEFNLEHLSDGEKNLITLIGDIARRLAIANTTMKNPLHGDGVILIDEIDLHLHPNWQRLMIPRLTEIFPNCQFIITTHSPQVISHVQPHSLILLKNDKNTLTARKSTESYGKNIDRILEDILEVDTRPDDIIEKFNQLEDSIDDNNLDKAKSLLNELDNMIIGGDPKLVRARAIIKRKEVLGR